jgi:beta-mannosidase
LRRHEAIPDPFVGTNEQAVQWIEDRDWEYRCVFSLTREALSQDRQIELVADGLDTVATVTLNGRQLGRTDNMFVAHRWPVASCVHTGRNELRILFRSAVRYAQTVQKNHRPFEFNDPVGGCTRLRKQQCQFGWDWGPRFVTAGVWRDIRLELWSSARLAHVHVTQTHSRNGDVVLTFSPEIVGRSSGIQYSGTISIDGKMVASIEQLKARIAKPRLWWPGGQGAQPLYDVELVAHDADGRELGRWRRRIGLRTIRLDRRPDRWGESFCFVVNGRPVFAKGANWIPAHSFVAGLARVDYERDLRSAHEAHMNMIRVWGGGIYESEDFYDLCDELGLLVWQDFMFACALYPGDPAFVASVHAEATQQVKRLQHHACLALWCGNNEVAQLNEPALKKSATRRAYDRLFHATLPDVVAAHDGVTAYWPSSPWRGDGDNRPEAGERCGDTHYWDVWHARAPVKDYEKWRFRFLSEFGMQSYSSPETQATFCAPGEANIFGPVMENHQKNRAGNPIIIDYLSRRYRYPKDQDTLIYLSQINQAYCLQTAIEHSRRIMPRCMGTLYWQLNDCWPVASWSSLEFPGRWKAAHYAARRFYSPSLVSAHVPGDELAVANNHRRSTVRLVHLYTTHDAPEAAEGCLSWELLHLDGRVVIAGTLRVHLRPGESRCWRTLDLAKPLARFGREQLYLRIALSADGREVSGDTVFLAPPRFMNLPQAKTNVKVHMLSKTHARLSFKSSAFQHRFVFGLRGIEHRASDNFFDLYPEVVKTVDITLPDLASASVLRAKLHWQSLADSCV